MALDMNGVHHIELSLPELDRGRFFDVGVIGFRQAVCRGSGSQPSLMGRLMRLGGATGRLLILKARSLFPELFGFPSPFATPAAAERGVNKCGSRHLSLKDDVDATFARLAAGVDLHCQLVPRSGLKLVYHRHVFGNLIQLQPIVPQVVGERLRNASPAGYVAHRQAAR
ncbi:hypothetical protein [Rhizorhabdus dicambivorans]|uniref:Uncharacterized protein n=1 Tax=Rhizorhabdus dicambivorans TaxID=1850238 RepID=A0A2A4FN11_9SPHN|nr:hypothetical protein [Rhizorhabdus dicambivorans]PCE40145.1 hypothetical protein COO09_21810 [Rhizorhabdus dicambivorans]